MLASFAAHTIVTVAVLAVLAVPLALGARPRPFGDTLPPVFKAR